MIKIFPIFLPCKNHDCGVFQFYLILLSLAWALYWSLFLIKSQAGGKTCNFIKKWLQRSVKNDSRTVLTLKIIELWKTGIYCNHYSFRTRKLDKYFSLPRKFSRRKFFLHALHRKFFFRKYFSVKFVCNVELYFYIKQHACVSFYLKKIGEKDLKITTVFFISWLKLGMQLKLSLITQQLTFRWQIGGVLLFKYFTSWKIFCKMIFLGNL